MIRSLITPRAVWLYVFLFLLLGLAPSGRAQGWRPNWAWAKTASSGPGVTAALQMLADGAGNAYATGYLEDSTAFDPSQPPQVGYYVAKFNAAGQLLWRHSMPGGAFGRIALDQDGNCYVALAPYGGVQFAGAPVNGPGQISVLKLNPAGQVQWVQPVVMSQFLFVHALTIDQRKNILLLFEYSGQATVDNLQLPTITSTNRCLTVVKLDSARQRQWVFQSGGTRVDISPQGLAVDSAGNVYTSGTFSGRLAIGGFSQASIYSNIKEMYLAKITPQGQARWLRVGRAPVIVSGGLFHSGLVVDPAGNSYLAGYGDSAQFTGVSTPWRGGFIAKYNTTGSPQWVRSIMSASRQGPNSWWHTLFGIALDAAGDVYATGYYQYGMAVTQDTVWTDLDTLGTYQIHAFVVKYRADGHPLWQQIMGTHGQSGRSYGRGIAVGPDQTCFLTGEYFGSVWLDTIPLLHRDTLGLFVARLNRVGAMLGGAVFRDDNANRVREPTEPRVGVPVVVEVQPGPRYVTTVNGRFGMEVPLGQYRLRVPNPPHLFTATGPQVANLTVLGQVDTTRYLGLWPEVGVGDLRITLTPMGEFRQFEDVRYVLTCTNVGSARQNATVQLTLDPHLTYQRSSPVGSVSGQQVTWSLGAFGALETRRLVVVVRALTIGPLGSSATSVATVTGTMPDQNPADNTDTSITLFRTSYDPNDKLVTPAAVTPSQVQSQQWLTYTVRFQNTGNASARRVQVIDTLSPRLQRASVQLLSSSHNLSWQLKGTGVLAFDFPNINLPDSTADEPGSHGFVKFRVFADSTLALGDSVTNEADIYFDYNVPVRTNTVVTRVQPTVLGLATPDGGGSFTLYPNPAGATAYLSLVAATAGPLTVRVSDALGQVVWQEQTQVPAGRVSRSLPTGKWAAGVYQVQVRGGAQVVTRRLVVQP